MTELQTIKMDESVKKVIKTDNIIIECFDMDMNNKIFVEYSKERFCYTCNLSIINNTVFLPIRYDYILAFLKYLDCFSIPGNNEGVKNVVLIAEQCQLKNLLPGYMHLVDIILEEYISKFFMVEISALCDYIKCDIYSPGVMYQFLNIIEMKEEHIKIKNYISEYKTQKLYAYDSDTDDSDFDKYYPTAQQTKEKQIKNHMSEYKPQKLYTDHSDSDDSDFDKYYLSIQQKRAQNKIINKQCDLVPKSVIDTEIRNYPILKLKSLQNRVDETISTDNLKTYDSDRNKQSDFVPKRVTETEWHKQSDFVPKCVTETEWHNRPRLKLLPLRKCVNDTINADNSKTDDSDRNKQSDFVPKCVTETEFHNRPVLELKPLRMRTGETINTDNSKTADSECNKQSDFVPRHVTETEFRDRPILKLKPWHMCVDETINRDDSKIGDFDGNKQSPLQKKEQYNLPVLGVKSLSEKYKDPISYNLSTAVYPNRKTNIANLSKNITDITISEYGNKYISIEELEIIKNVGDMTPIKKKILDEQKMLESTFQS
jgi:hypothetical protein